MSSKPARGGLVDEAALADALERGHLAGAACDVFQMEPDANPRLAALPVFLGTPHIGGASQEAQLAMGRAAIDGLKQLTTVEQIARERGVEVSSLPYRSRAKVKEAV